MNLKISLIIIYLQIYKIAKVEMSLNAVLIVASCAIINPCLSTVFVKKLRQNITKFETLFYKKIRMIINTNNV